jgi:hypothetical protein
MNSRWETNFYRRRSLLPYGLIALAGVASSGCSRPKDKWLAMRPPLYKARGRVTWNGEPAQGVLVALRSDTLNVTATGLTNDRGEFVLTSYRSGDGAAAGDHAVTITKRVDVQDKNGNSVTFNLMPLKYEDRDLSGLTATIAENNNNVLEFEVEGPRREFKDGQP